MSNLNPNQRYNWTKAVKYRSINTPSSRPAAKMYKDGTLVLSPELFSMLDSDYVVVYADRGNRVIGLQPVEETDAHRNDVFKLIGTNQDRQRYVGCAKFLRECGFVNTSTINHWMATRIEDGMVVIDIDDRLS